MIPKLYLILSDDRAGLVKMGRTEPTEVSPDDMAVIKRVQQYATGIPDSATVVQANGAAVFEPWLHRFIGGGKKKPVTIRFAFRPGTIIKPKEWFELPPDVAQILATAFISDPPKTVDEVDISDLPVFLSGAMAVINWHAEQGSSETLATMAATAQVRSLVDSMRSTERPPAQTPVAPSLSSTTEVVKTTQPSIPAAARDLLNAHVKLAGLQTQMRTMQETEILRTHIAIATAILTAVIAILGTPSGAVWFAILGTLLLAFWPNVLPRAAAWLIDQMRQDATRARARIKDE